MRVQELMTSSVQACGAETNLATAAGLMWDYNCGALPVVDGSGKVVGMITDRDIAIAVGTRGQLAAEIAVADVIARRAATCLADDDVLAALQTMGAERVRRLPVVNQEGVLQGMFSLDDAAIHAQKSLPGHTTTPTYEDVIAAYRAICERPLVAQAAAA